MAGKKGKGKVRRAADAAQSAGRTIVYYVGSKATKNSTFGMGGLKKVLKRAIQVGIGGAGAGIITVVGDVANVTSNQYALMAAAAEGVSAFVGGADSMADSFAGAMVAHVTVKGGASAIKGLLGGGA